ncbi:MAG: GNAT family N-acetyltransferase [Planctomycetota bacterium]
MQIRPFEPRDAEFCFQTRTDAYTRKFYDEIGPEAVAAGIKAYLPGDYNCMAEKHPVFIIEINGEPSGFFVIRRESATEAELFLIYLDLDHVGRGMGRACVEFMESWIKQNWAGVDTFFVDTVVPGYNGGFYRKAGFQPQEEVICAFPGLQVKALRLSKPLKGFNVYEDDTRAASYATLEFPGTYYLAYRDLPQITAEHAKGRKAIDFGCGAGRSTRFLKKLGFEAVGVDISASMLRNARQIDPEGDYRLVPDGDLSPLKSNAFDLVLSAFTFDNIPTLEKKVNLFREFKRVLNRGGVVVNLVSTPEIYLNEWASFSTNLFPENRTATCGEIVRTMMKDVDDKRPVEDILWPDEDYKRVFREAGLEWVKSYKPLAREEEPYEWINETRIAPWIIYVLKNV